MKRLSILILIVFIVASNYSYSDTNFISEMKQKTTENRFKKTLNKKESNNQTSHNTLIVGVLAFTATVGAAILGGFITNKGIKANKEIALKQIENSQLTTKQQFHATLKTKNRQEWIDDVRESISELISSCIKINIEFQDPSVNSKERIKDIHEKITLHRARLRLLLSTNEDKKTHAIFLASLRELIDKLDHHVANYRSNISDWKNKEFQDSCDTLVDNGRALLYDEWKKIQNLTI